MDHARLESYLRAGLEAQGHGRHAEASELLRQAAALVAELPETDARRSTTLIFYATNELCAGQLDAARATFEAVLAQLDGLATRDENLELNRATCLNNLGLVYKQLGEYAKAESAYTRVLPLLERFKDPSDPAIAATRSNIAVIYMQQGNYAAAELLLLESLGQETHHADRPDERIPTSLNQLVRAYLGQGKVDEAEKLLRGCVAIWEQHGWPRSSVTAGILDSYVELLEGSGRAAEAAAVRSRIAELMSEPELG